MTELGLAPPPDAPVALGDVVVRTEHLTKRYGTTVAVDDLALAVPRNSVYGLIGPNGAGKTTTFAILATMLAPSGGVVEVLGYDPARHARELRRLIGYVPDVLGLYDGLRVWEYLEFFASAYKLPRPNRAATLRGLLELVDLTDKRDAFVDSLSRGMKQRLSLARALIHDPELLILDEPASGLDPRARVELRILIHGLRDLGKTVVISSHILAEVEELCTVIGIMQHGRLVTAGPIGSLGHGQFTSRRMRVRVRTGEVTEYAVADEADMVKLLRRLIRKGIEVVEYAEVSEGLEEIFLRVTSEDAR